MINENNRMLDDAPASYEARIRFTEDKTLELLVKLQDKRLRLAEARAWLRDAPNSTDPDWDALRDILGEPERWPQDDESPDETGE